MSQPLLRPIRLRTESAASARKVTWQELFFDLAFVAAVSEVGGPLEADYSAAGLLRYGFLLFLIWWAWLGHTLYLNRFDTDDLVQRLLTLAQIFGVGVMAINADEALDSRSSAGFAAAYAGLRIVLAGEYLRAMRVRRVRTFALYMALGTAGGAALWLSSALVPAPARYSLWTLAFAVEVLTPMLAARDLSAVPPDTSHLPERFGLFTIILLGESLVAVMRGMKTQDTWSVPAASAALFGMAMAFTFWWWYFDGVDAAGERHVHTRRDGWALHVWTYAHLPLYLGIGVAAVGMEHVIRYATTAPLHAAEAWMLCAGLACAMGAVTIIADTHPRPAREVRRRRRLAAHGGLAALTLAAGAMGALVNPALLLIILVVITLMQVIVSMLWMPRSRVHALAGT